MLTVYKGSTRIEEAINSLFTGYTCVYSEY